MRRYVLHAIKYDGLWSLCKADNGEWRDASSYEFRCYIGAEEKAVTLD